MPVLCGKCKGRSVESIVTAIEQHIVDRCRCYRLWNRTTGRPQGDVVYYSGGKVHRLVAGDAMARPVSPTEAAKVMAVVRERDVKPL